MAINPQPQTPPPPSITISTDLTSMVNAAQQALLHMPGAPRLFQRARQLCLIAHGVKPPKWLQRPADAPVIVELDRDYLLELVNQAADWQKMSKKKTQAFDAAMPPAQVIKTLLARPIHPFPLLEGVICAPTLKPDGEILATPGYDPDTGLSLDLNGTTYPPIPRKATLDQARSAIGRLQEAFTDFPWIHAPQGLSSALAALLSLVARYAFAGNVPLFAVRSTTRGSGKGLLIDAISLIATGRQAPRWAHTLDEEEERKRLLTLGLAGDSLVHIDNVVHALGSGPLDLAITAPTFCDRILGTQKRQEVPMNVVFFASGNNMVFRGDMARRVLPIDLDPKVERPEERDDFAHSPLLPWILTHRPQFVVDALTILKAYFVAGCPSQSVKPFGSFEEWSDLIRQALIWAGEADPCAGRLDIEAESDPQYEAFQELLRCWQTCYATTKAALPLKRVVQDAMNLGAPKEVKPFIPNDYDALREALGYFDGRYDGQRLHAEKIGNALRAWKGRILNNMRLVTTPDTHTKTALWRVEVL
jgi:hypothetical protein